MSQRFKISKWVAAVSLLFGVVLLLSGCGEQVIVMDPKGPIGAAQKDLIIISTILCLIILVPVLALTAFIVFRYRDKPGNKASYKPNWAHSNKLEIIWWSIPIVIIAVLAVFTVKGTYALEPSKPIASDKEPLVVQATSLDWKWLFTYPEQGIATVNYLYIPEDRPIKFELTSDAPMNSFWIPQLGGQMYTMSGMAMTLYLQADEPGMYYGSGANFSGEHFADMTFDVHAISDAQFEKWVHEVKRTSAELTKDGYTALATPGKAEPTEFSSFPDGLFESIVTKYAAGGSAHSHHGSGGHGEMSPKAHEPVEMTSDEAHHHSGH